MTDLNNKTTNPLPLWSTLLAWLALLSGVLISLLTLFDLGNPELLERMASWLSISCGMVAALLYIVLRPRNRARAAFLGNLALVGGMFALLAWYVLSN